MLDCFGIMHEPDQRSAFAQRANVTTPGGVLLLQYHSIVTIVEQGQWNSLRHGHFAYYSMTTLTRLLERGRLAGCHRMGVRPLRRNGIARSRTRRGEPDESVQRILATEDALGITDPAVVGGLQRSADQHIESLRSWLKRSGQPAAPSSRTAPRRVRSHSSAARGSIRGWLRRSPTPRPQTGQADAGHRHPDRFTG